MASTSDDFNRSDVSPLGGNWEIMYGDGHQIISNAVAAVDATGATVSAWAASNLNFTDNQLSRATLSANTGSDYPGVAVRMLTTSGGQGYILIARSFGEFTLYKVTAGTVSYLADWAATIGGTDNFELEADGDGTSTDLIVRHNGSLVGTYTDSSSPHTGGQPGIYYDYQNTNASRITSWYAEDDAVAGGTTYTQTITDTASFSDSTDPMRVRGRIALDTASFADNAIRDALFNRFVSDSVSIQSEDEIFREFNYELSDSMDVTDSSSAWILRNRMIDEGVTLLELVTALYVPNTGNIINEATITDTLALTDSLERLLEFNRSAEDTLSFSDLQLLSSVFNRETQDSVVVTDEQILQLAWTKVLTDQLDALDSLVSTYLPSVLYDVRVLIGSSREGMPLVGSNAAGLPVLGGY
jgi:hypothetical protein